MKRLLALLAAPAALALSTPAKAAPVAADPPAEAEALILFPLTLERLEDLDFGTIVPSATSGTVTVPADGSPATVAGGVALVSSTPPTRARFAGAGAAGQRVIINLPPVPFTLDGPGSATVTVQALTLDGPVAPTIGATRSFFFHVGGILQVGANQTEGLYEAEFNVTVEYL